MPNRMKVAAELWKTADADVKRKFQLEANNTTRPNANELCDKERKLYVKKHMKKLRNIVSVIRCLHYQIEADQFDFVVVYSTVRFSDTIWLNISLLQ